MKSLDRIDEAIVRCLSENGRTSTAEIARRVSLSSPSVSERVKRLEEAGVITGYQAVVSPSALGRPISAWLRIRPVPGKMQRVASIVQGLPEIVQCHRVTGDDCFLALAHLKSIQDMERIIDQIIPHATTNTSVVQSSLVERRLPPLT